MGNIGLGDVFELDKLMMKHFTTIKMRMSKLKDSVIATNTCEHCGAIQGYYYVVDDPDANLDFERSKYLFTTIQCQPNEALRQALSCLD